MDTKTPTLDKAARGLRVVHLVAAVGAKHTICRAEQDLHDGAKVLVATAADLVTCEACKAGGSA